MKIFKKQSNSYGKRKVSRARKISMEDKGKSNLKKLHPMCYSLLSIKAAGDRPNEWVASTFDVINNRPHSLSEKWINSINSWTESLIESMMLDEPDVEEGDRAELGPFKLLKIIPPKQNAEFPTSAMLLVDKRGWKWYLKSSKSNKFNVGDNIALTATVSSHKEGITFLKRASKIRSVGTEVGIFK